MSETTKTHQYIQNYCLNNEVAWIIIITYLNFLRNECLFFWDHGEWIVARDKQIVWTAAVLGRLFVPRSDSFPINPEKKNTHSLYLQKSFYQRLFVKLANKSHKFKFLLVMGTYTVNMVIFSGGKFRKNFGKTFLVGVIFRILLLFPLERQMVFVFAWGNFREEDKSPKVTPTRKFPRLQ